MKDQQPNDRWRATRGRYTLVVNAEQLRVIFDKYNSDLTSILQLGVGHKHTDTNGVRWERIA